MRETLGKWNSINVLLLVGLGLGLFGLHLALAIVSEEFAPGKPKAEQPILTSVSLELAAAVVFLIAIWVIRSMSFSRALLVWVIVVGALIRCVMFFSTPILEDDYLRYLLDGAVVANGHNPYRYAPSELQTASETLSQDLRNLAVEGEQVICRINHPHLRTVYPPVAQVAFAAAHFVKPWSLLALRAVLGLFDVAILILLIWVLRGLGISTVWSMVYWWNPLVVQQIYNCAHMDVIAVSLALGAVALSLRRRHISAAGALALGIGTKLWPVMLAPVLLRPLRSAPLMMLVSVAVMGLAAAGMFLPVYLSGLDKSSGFAAYGQRWEMNDALYMLFSWSVGHLVNLVGRDWINPQMVTRVVVFLTLVAWIARTLRKGPASSLRTCESSLLIVAAVFMLSPTQFPWYYVWVVPFLAIRPLFSLLVLNALLPLYYLRFHFAAHGDVGVFDNQIVWLEYVPAWVIMIWEWTLSRRGKSPYLSQAEIEVGENSS